MATEKLKFKIELYSVYYNKPPIAEIFIKNTDDKSVTNDTIANKNLFDYDSNKPILNINNSYFNNEVVEIKKQPAIIEFEHTFENNKSYDLVINRSGKDKRQTVIKDGKIIIDQVLYIKSIEIDEVDIGPLIYEGVYKPRYPEPWASEQIKKGIKLPESLKNSPDLGHNGVWTFTFESPFYMWLLEHLY